MEKQDYVKSLMEYPSVQEMVDCERADAKEEGIQIGIQMGIEQERFNLILNMLAEGLDPAMVAKIAGLTENEVVALAQQ